MGRRVASPLIEEGGADFLVSFDSWEALRMFILGEKERMGRRQHPADRAHAVIHGRGRVSGEIIPERLAASGVSVDADGRAGSGPPDGRRPDGQYGDAGGDWPGDDVGRRGPGWPPSRNAYRGGTTQLNCAAFDAGVLRGKKENDMYWNPSQECMPCSRCGNCKRSASSNHHAMSIKTSLLPETACRKRGSWPGDIRSLGRSVPAALSPTKQDLRDNYPYGLFAVPLSEIVRIHASSGTTASHTVVGYTQRDIQTWAELMARTS
jgi:hypothetical protein